jgi:translation initiation factor IF-2
MAVTNTKRLSQVARELNVGISTIVEYLHKKGLEIDSSPNTKIEAEHYTMLLNAFRSDKSAKKESEKISKRKIGIRETVSLENELFEKNEISTSSENHLSKEKELISKQKTQNLKPEIAQDEEKVEISNEHKIEGPKIIGKINLNETKKSEVTEIHEVKETQTENEEEKEIIESEKEAEIKIEQEIIITAELPTVNEATVQTIQAEEKSVTMPEDEKELKILGKIDLDSLNQKTRPEKKTRRERERERVEREKQRIEKLKEVEEKTKEIEKEAEAAHKKPTLKLNTEDFIETKFTQLTGPTVIGKIDLKEEKTADDKKRKRKKRKRKRINKPISIETVEKEKGTHILEKKKKTPTKKKAVKVDVDEKEVQNQVKETLAKLTAKKKKSAVKYRRDKRDEIREKHQKEVAQQQLEEKILKVTEFVSANELASLMNIPVNQVISTCFDLGKLVQINQRLDAETITIVAEEHGYQVNFVSVTNQEDVQEEEIEDENLLISRPPIVTVMGHVDHGKTSLLDYIRKTNVIAGEAGGITQHIGAYSVELKDGQKITFLDTPGHEAFTAMRARGAQVTDVAIIVIAADDNIMPQTIEAINHAQAAGVPIIFAINKIDKNGASPERIKQELAEMNLLVEEWGGKYQSKDISAKQGLNVEALLDEVLLAAEMLDLKANPDRRAKGSVIESSLDKGRGYVATVLVQTGTLKTGDIVLAGSYSGKIKAMFNERNQKIDSAGPSEPAMILGLDGAPQAGDNFMVLQNEREARELATKYGRIKREQALRAQKHITLEEIGRRLKIGNFQQLNVIVKGDVDGSIEALADSLLKLSTEEIQINIIHQAVGQISEADVMLAAASDAVIIGFQVRPASNARKLAEKEEIEIRLYSVIYDAIEDLKDAMEGMLSPEMKEEITATVEIREVFKITKVGTVAGAYVLDGKVARDSQVRLIRDGIVVYDGKLGSLRRFKDDVKEVTKGFECGLNIDKFNDIKEGDIVEAYNMVEVAKKLK